MNLEESKLNVIANYKTLKRCDIENNVSNEYIQHNPAVANVTYGFIGYFEKMQQKYPEKTIEFVRCLAEEDLVCKPTKSDWETMRLLSWTFLDLMKTVTYVNIGMPSSRFLNFG